MVPVNLEIKKQNYIIIHRCQKCGLIKKNKMSKSDNFETLLKINKKQLAEIFVSLLLRRPAL